MKDLFTHARAHARAIGFALKIMPMLPSGPVDWLTRTPVRESVEYDTVAGHVSAELYRPPGRGPHPAVVVCLGVVPIGIDHPQVARMQDALARSGFIALMHWSPAMRDLRLVPEDKADIATAYAYLLSRPDVDPTRSGLMGACVGGSFALLAAADPAIHDRIAFVVAFAPYSSLWTFVRDIASRSCVEGTAVVPWAVDPLTHEVFVRSLTDCLPLAEANALRAASAGGKPVDELALSAEARAVHRLFKAADRSAAELALRVMPAALRERLDAMSPLHYIGLLTAPRIMLGHDRDDLVVPVGESRRLARALAARPGLSYTEYGMFQHADPTKRKLSPLRLARELRRFYLSLYPMFRQAAGYAAQRSPRRSAGPTRFSENGSESLSVGTSDLR